MKNKLYGNGIDSDYEYIQELLDSNKKHITIPKPQKWYLIDKTLYIHNGQTLEFEKDSIIRLKDGSNCAMISNYEQEQGTRDITIIGGIWDMNNINQKPNDAVKYDDVDPYTSHVYNNDTFFEKYVLTDGPYKDTHFPKEMYGFLMVFYNVNNITIKNLMIRDPVTYGVWMGRVDGFNIQNIIFDYEHCNPYFVNMDGIHIEGWARNGLIKNLEGTCYDDMVAFTDEITKGDFENITVDGLYSFNSHSAVRLLSCPSKYNNIIVKNITGTFYQYVIGFTKYFNYDNGIMGEFNNIIIDNLKVSRARKYMKYKKGTNNEQFPIFYFERETKTNNLTIKNVFRDEHISGCELIGIENGALIEGLTLENIKQISTNGIVFKPIIGYLSEKFVDTTMPIGKIVNLRMKKITINNKKLNKKNVVLSI